MFGTDFLLKNTSPRRRKFYHIIDFFMQFYFCLPKQAMRGEEYEDSQYRKPFVCNPTFKYFRKMSYHLASR